MNVENDCHLNGTAALQDASNEQTMEAEQNLDIKVEVSEIRPICPIDESASLLLKKLSLYDIKCKFTTSDLYKYTYKFYKDKSGKAMHLTYADKCRLVALSQQISSGAFNPASVKTLGVLDVIGRDRRLAWQSLGSTSKEEAMEEFVLMLNNLTPTLKPYIEALWADYLEKERIQKEEEIKLKEEEEFKLIEEENKRRADAEMLKQEETKRSIQEALNQQTFLQFKSYSEQQFPGNPEQQAVLIKQLQQQHYQQYMQQIYQQQLSFSQSNNNEEESQKKTQVSGVVSRETESRENSRANSPNGVCDTVVSEEEKQSDEEEPDLRIAPASMWTRRDLKDFKSSIMSEGGDSILKVGHGETVTVRVPTHADGASLFWEFATDSFDIGFGVSFEWTKDEPSVVSVHITESDDDEDDEDVDDDNEADDLEKGGGAGGATVESTKPPQSVIIPVYRRDCHEEVYAGSHAYPGSGVYLLKFDNSYSLWRNKVLYYKVYYTR